jgi:peptide-methionine (S)-S-oxide reductase
MGRLDVEVEDKLEQRLRMAVLKRYGGRKGDLKKAIVDAIERWLREEIATLGGGCFWCTEAIFSELKGVQKVESGYAGGTIPNPTYQQVCTGNSGHAEVAQITFDPNIISYKDLLRIFFTVLDPTNPNRQGADIGTNYRSVIFYHNDRQKLEASEVIQEVTTAGLWNAPILTQLEPFEAFYLAEHYHQEYFKNNPSHPYCQMVIAPKIRKLREHYIQRLTVSA